MRRYNLLQPLWLSFYSKPLYRDVQQNWHGIVFGYLFLLSTLYSIIFAICAYAPIKEGINQLQPWFIQLPVVTLKEGMLNIDKPVPYYINYPNVKQTFAIIDTSGSIKSLDNTNATVLITSKQIFVKQQRGAVTSYRTIDLTKTENLQFNLPALFPYLKVIGWFLFFFIYSVSVIFLFILGMIGALVYAALAKLFIKTSLSYGAVYRLSLVALTPKLLLICLLSLVAIPMVYKWILSFAVGFGYLVYAIEANKSISSSTE